MNIHPDFNQLLTVTFTLFAVIDIIGSIPLLHALKKKIGGLHEIKATLISRGLMILCLFVVEQFLNILGLYQRSFAVGGSIVIFILGLEMVLGIELFKSEPDAKASVVVPIAFPLIAGSGTLTTIMSLKANYDTTTVLLGIFINLLFIFVVLNLIARLSGFSLWQLLRFIRAEILVVLGTSSSEAVLPSMLERMTLYGCDRSVVGLVIPAGYSFNLDGTSIYLSMATLFIAQAFGVHLSLSQQLSVMAVLIVTSKGAAGVTGSGFIVLASTLSAMHTVPVEGIALVLGVDRFMSEARAITNLIGNAVAPVVIARSEGAFDPVRHAEAIAGYISEPALAVPVEA